MLVEPGDERIGRSLEQFLGELDEPFVGEFCYRPGRASELRVLPGDPVAPLLRIRHETGGGEEALELALAVADRVGADALAELEILLVAKPEQVADRQERALDAAFRVVALDRI